MSAFPDHTKKVDIVELSTNSVLRELCGNIAFVVPDVTDLTARETKIMAEIEKKYNLYIFSSVDAGDQDWSNFNVIILSTGLTLGDLDNLIHLEKPIITMDMTHPNGLLAMTSNAGTNTSNETQIDIQTIEQQIISGVGITATGYSTVYSASDTLTGVTLAGVSGIINLAVKVDTAYSCLTVLEKGATNASSNPNPDIRIFFGLLSGDKLNSTGLSLFLQTILYAGCMASSVSQSTYQLLLKLQTIEYKVTSPEAFPLGNMFFVSKTGNDSNDGTSWAKAKLTIDAGVGVCADDNNDYLFIQSGSYDEDANDEGVIVDINGIHIIGMGGDHGNYYYTQVTNSKATASSVFYVDANKVEITGIAIRETTNTVDGMVLGPAGVGTANYCYIHHNIIHGEMENGILMGNCGWTIIEYNIITGITNDGIKMTGASGFENIIRYNYMWAVGVNGIHLAANESDKNFVHGNIINGLAGTTNVGIQITFGDENFIMDNWISGCATPIGDTGTDNIWINNHIDNISSSFNILAADTTTITDKISNIDLPSSGRYVIQLDVATLITNESGKTVTFYVYVKIDATNYKVRNHVDFTAGTDTDHPHLEFETEGGNSKAKVASKMSTTSSGTRAIPYKIIQIS